LRSKYCRNQKTGAGMGRLPEKAPLANPYVPYQQNNAPMYDAGKALARGSLYCGLDLPFMGMVNHEMKNMSPKNELQMLGFVLQELALYLDTHPEDEEALQMYRNYQQAYHSGMMHYSEHCKPLSHTVPVNDKNYSWLKDPWPWEYAANKEG